MPSSVELWKPGVYRARASLAPIPLALVLMEASTELRTRGLSNIGIIVRLANLTPRITLPFDKIIREYNFGGRRIAVGRAQGAAAHGYALLRR